ncbi:MAG: right-handed parallel beta-helix repeat-containing protein [Coleofasciculus sp. D1-CHI-01]|uniref:right-handed parallel beta-helix repeat-containing protein n=1 Tax=Coleofasciculus sp. D1-CHI-01 TaxID=3068482 RepID=UPI0032FD451D
MAAIHRRWFLQGSIAFGATSLALIHQKAIARNSIYVSNAEEFFYAIGSNRTIILKPGIYFLSEISGESEQDHARFEPVHDGKELVISKVENLKIIGEIDDLVSLIVNPRYANVLKFDNCNNVEIENIKGGHLPELGYCRGGVLFFRNTSHVHIQDCVLFGSGIWGIEAIATENLTCRRTIIRDCTYRILRLTDINTATFIDCHFFDNRRFEMVMVRSSQNVEFRNCDFRTNRVDTNWNDSFFLISESEPVRLIDCLFRDNEADILIQDTRLLNMSRTRFENNSFQVPNNTAI